MIGEKDLSIIERSLQGDLDSKEITEFEHRLKTDSEFAMHYSILQELPEVITTDVNGFRADLQSIMGKGKVLSMPKKEPRSLTRIILAIAAIGVGVAMIAVLLNIRATPDLFAENFIIPSENITTRASRVVDPELQNALISYNQENFIAAAKSFEIYLRSNPEDQAAKFYLGISLLSTEKYVEAINHFESLEKDANPFQNSALWYHALIELKLGQNIAAQELFTKLANTPRQSYQQKSQAILDKLNL